MNKKEFYDAFKKSVTCAITCLIIFFSAIFCFYAGYKFGRERVLDSNSTDVVSYSIQSKSLDTLSVVSPADSIDFTFSGSPIYLPFTYFSVGTLPETSSAEYTSYVGKFTFFISSNSSFIRFVPTSTSGPGRDIPINNLVYDSLVVSSYSIRGEYLIYGYYVQPNFNFNVNKIIIGSHAGIDGFTDSTDYRTYYVQFFDNNDNYFEFQIYLRDYDASTSYYDFTSRIYFLGTYFDDNSFYNQGYTVGYQNGMIDGESTGYNTGYNTGYQDGELSGYYDGLNTADSYSFSNFLTAVVEAPVNVFINLLDFNIMGYNLLSLVVGLLTLGVIVLIIKLCLGGK